MSRRYADPIEIWLARTGCAEEPIRPQRFRWRQRSYRVVVVLARWVESDAWWRRAAGSVTAGAGVPAGPESPGDRVLWRVEARLAARAGVYDLCQDHRPRAGPTAGPGPPGDRWYLVRALD